MEIQPPTLVSRYHSAYQPASSNYNQQSSSSLERNGSLERRSTLLNNGSGSWRYLDSEPDYGAADLSHLSEIQQQIERVQHQEQLTWHQQLLTSQETETTITEQEQRHEEKSNSGRLYVSRKQQSRPPRESSREAEHPESKPLSEDKSSSAKSSLSKSSGEQSAAAGAALGLKKKEKKSSLSTIFSVFSRKKSSQDKKKKSSLAGLIEASGSSVLSPEVQRSIIDEEEGAEFKAPTTRSESGRVSQTSGHVSQSSGHVSQTYIHLTEPSVTAPTPPPMARHSYTGTPILGYSRVGTPGLSRGTTPDPDYDNLSMVSNSPRAPRLRPHSGGGGGNSSDTSCDDVMYGYGGRFTPRSTVSEYRMAGGASRNSIAGLGRGVSPSPSEPPIPSRRAPSTDSFFGKNGANLVSGGSNTSQKWYQNYKHSSFTNPAHQNVFGEHPGFGAFDGRITNIRGIPTYYQ